MKLPSIAFAAVFAIIAGVPSPAGAEGRIEAYPASYDGGDAYFVRTSNGKHLVTMLEPETGAHAGIIFVKTKDPRLGLTASNLLSLPPGRLKIVVDRLSPGSCLKVLALSDSGHVVSERIVNFAENFVDSANSQQREPISVLVPLPPPVVAANRVLLVELVATNIFGQNEPAIFKAEFEYLEFWAQDVAAMVEYHGGSSAATALFEQIDNSAP